MPRFIVERGGVGVCRPYDRDGVRHARTFAMGGKTFDVYIAKDRASFRHFTRISNIAPSRTFG